MTRAMPSKVLIYGGKPWGGVASFAEALCAGFCACGVPAEVLSPRALCVRWREMRDPAVLKILSTTAVLAAPFARRSICVAHGFPRADVQGWSKMLAIVASLKLACRFSTLVTVSEYSAVHLRSVFNLRIDAVIHNPLHRAFLPRAGEPEQSRDYITYVGRLHPCKRLEQVVPAMCALVRQTPGLRACIVGDGELRGSLEKLAGGDPRIEFKGALPPEEVRKWLRRSKVFVSGCETEALGIAYIEALSQGCVVAMPACGGGLEIVPTQIGKSIQLIPLPLDEHGVESVLQGALDLKPDAPLIADYEAAHVAANYLELDRRRISQPLTGGSRAVVRAGKLC